MLEKYDNLLKKYKISPEMKRNQQKKGHNFGQNTWKSIRNQLKTIEPQRGETEIGRRDRKGQPYAAFASRKVCLKFYSEVVYSWISNSFQFLHF